MQKLKLDLGKQSVVRLNEDETQSIYGGGKARSKRRSGDCAYSRKHGDSATEWCEGTRAQQQEPSSGGASD